MPAPATMVSSTTPSTVANASSGASFSTISNAISAAVAPIGSMRTPSARRIGPVEPAGLTKRSRGPTTVGPVTTRTAPSTMAA